MKESSTLRPGVGSTRRLFVIVIVIVLAVFGVLQSGCSGCRGPTDRQAASLKRVEAFKQAEALKGAQAAASSPAGFVPVCPGSLAASPTGKGAHKVILSWKASAPGDSNHGAAVGYCIYRGSKHKDPSPQLLNPTPFAGTTCIDDLVVNDQKYYYVVRAIGLQGNTSDISNEVPAVIPAGSQSSKVPALSAPLCRPLPAAVQ